MSDEWTRDQAALLCVHHRASMYGVMEYDAWEGLERRIATALREAEERGYKRGAMPTGELTSSEVDRLDRASQKLNAAYVEGRQSLLARLREPDEAMVEFVAKLMCSGCTEWNDCPSCYSDDGRYEGCGTHWHGWRDQEAPRLLRALADHLDKRGGDSSPWATIASAPTDGTVVMVWQPEYKLRRIASWKDGQLWLGDFVREARPCPDGWPAGLFSHWAHLLPPPPDE